MIGENYGSHIVFMEGDFNINLLSSDSNDLCSEYVNLMYAYNLLPTILRPTRVACTSFTLIDNIWISSYSDFLRSGIVMTNISDHYAVYSVVGGMKSSVAAGFTEITKRILNPDNLLQVKAAIERHNFDEVFTRGNVDESYDLFSSDLLSIYDSFCPVKTVKFKNLDVKKPYITSEIKQLLKEKHRLQKKYNKYPITYGREYRLLRNSLNSRIRTAKKIYFRSEFRDTRDTKAAWKVINGLLGREQKLRLPDFLRQRSFSE